MGTTAEKLAHAKAVKADLKAALTEKGQNPGDVFDTYPDLVRAIETGTKLPDLTNPGAAADLRKGKQLIGQSGQIVTGTLEEVQQATPSISVSSSGLITATAGDKSATKQLSTQAGGTRTPGTSDAIIAYNGQYVTGNITMKGDANLIPENIKSGVSIFGVAGSAGTGSGLKAVRITGFTYNDDTSAYTLQLSEPLNTLTALYFNWGYAHDGTIDECIKDNDQFEGVSLIIDKNLRADICYGAGYYESCTTQKVSATLSGSVVRVSPVRQHWAWGFGDHSYADGYAIGT